jgi:hypothetical protein
MNTRTRKNFICMLLIAAFVSFLPLSANAYQVNLTGYQSGYNSSGEIYGYLNASPAQTVFFFCVETDTQVYVPGTYYARDLALTANEMKAAWLMDTYAPTTRGAYTGYNPLQTGVAVQEAIWSVLEMTGFTSDSDVLALRATLIGSIPVTLPNLNYVHVDLYSNTSLTSPVQDFIRPVPLPPAAWLLGSGLIGLVVIRRRMKK